MNGMKASASRCCAWRPPLSVFIESFDLPRNCECLYDCWRCELCRTKPKSPPARSTTDCFGYRNSLADENLNDVRQSTAAEDCMWAFGIPAHKRLSFSHTWGHFQIDHPAAPMTKPRFRPVKHPHLICGQLQRQGYHVFGFTRATGVRLILSYHGQHESVNSEEPRFFPGKEGREVVWGL